MTRNTVIKGRKYKHGTTVCKVCGREFVNTKFKCTYCSNECKVKDRIETEKSRYKKIGEYGDFTMSTNKKWSCHVYPCLENCSRCPLPDCVNNRPATAEETETINRLCSMFDKVTRHRKDYQEIRDSYK